MKQTLNIFLLLTAAIFSLWCTGDLMRKNDQATILAGANDLAHGRMQEPSAYYQFDKTYITYAVCAGIMKLLPFGNLPVAAVNISLALIFWSALTVFVIRFRQLLSPAVLFCFLTAPAVLFNTVYVNSTVLSSAFILISALCLLNTTCWCGWPASLFFFLAVGARADAILLLPLMLWLITPFPMVGKFLAGFSSGWKDGLRDMAVFSKHWKIVVAAALALLAGRIICPERGPAVDFLFNWKMVAGYTVFGFGAAGLLFIFYSIRLAGTAVKGKGAFEKIYSAAGLAAFLLPVLFFIPQLHAPRYFWRACEALLLLAASGRVPELKFRTAKYAAILIAAASLFVGVRLPELSRPQICASKPSMFPSGDGFYPMGASAAFMLRLRAASSDPLDHNQLVWNAVHQASFRFDDRNVIRVLYTPMYGYFLLEASLRGGVAECLPFSQLANTPFYADSRSLMRDDPKTPLNELSVILNLPAVFVSPVDGGVGVLQFGTGDLGWGRQTQLLNRLFSGNEYRVLSGNLSGLPETKTVAVSSKPFTRAQLDQGSGLYYCEDFLSDEEGVRTAQAVWPGWMSVRTFSPGR